MQSDEQNGLLVASFSLGLLGLLTTLLVNIVIQSLDRPTIVASSSLGLLSLLTTLLVNIVIQSLDRVTGGLLLPGLAGPTHHPTGEYCYTIIR